MKDYKFKNPPVRELIIGCQFKKNILSDTQIFDIYNQIKEDFPIVENKSASPSIVEEANSYPSINEMPDKYKRYLFFTENKNKVLQIQTNQIFFNWKKKENNTYPSYTSVYEDFYKYLEKLSINTSLINQYFLTYLDEFEWNNGVITDYINLFNINKTIKHIETTIAIPEKDLNSTFILKMNSAINNKTEKKILLMETTMRGFDDTSNMKDWFDTSHQKINQYFFKLLTNKSIEKFEKL